MARRATQTSEEPALFREKNDLAESMLWASVVYSLVPFMGIIFVPIGIVTGIYRIFAANGNRNNSVKSGFLCLITVIVILFIQIGLWWLLYAVPEMSR